MSLTKVTITNVSSKDTKNDGTPLVGKYGPYVLVGIQTQEHGDMWINGFAKVKPEWKGQTMELDIFEEEYNGKFSLKFKVPKKFFVSEDMWKLLCDRVLKLENPIVQSKKVEIVHPDFNPDEIPF